MPTSYLIRRAFELGHPIAPWDSNIPILPSLRNGEEDRRLLKVENIVTTSSSKSKELKRLTTKHTIKKKKKGHPRRKDDNKFSSLRFKSREPWATTLLFSSGNQVVAGTKVGGMNDCMCVVIRRANTNHQKEPKSGNLGTPQLYLNHIGANQRV